MGSMVSLNSIVMDVNILEELLSYSYWHMELVALAANHSLLVVFIIQIQCGCKNLILFLMNYIKEKFK